MHTFTHQPIEALTFNPFTSLSKDWALVSAGTPEKSNTMTVSWGMLGELWGKDVVTVFVRPQRYTYEFMEKYDNFTLSFFGSEYRRALSFCGSKSGRDFDKAEECGLTAFETGESVAYGLFNAQDRGALFIGPGVAVYEGMVVGMTPKAEDIIVNVCKRKQLTNMRAAGSDEALRLTPPRQMSLEQCLEFLADDELLEVTPKHLRIRKRILNSQLRMKDKFGGKNRC